MKKLITTIIFIVSASALCYSQVYKGIVSYAHKEGQSKIIYYKKELSTVNGEYISQYKLFDENGICYSIIKVTHNRKEKTIKINAQPPKINVFNDGVYKYEFTYTDDLGLALSIPDKLSGLFGNGKNLISVTFYSSKKEHLKLNEIITGGTDIDNKFHYYLDK
jgi:hypothetical protein